jgi:hypothetical protein
MLLRLTGQIAAGQLWMVEKVEHLPESPEEEEEVRNAQLLLSPVKNAEERGRDIAHMVEEGEQEADDEDAVSAFLSERACCIVTAPPACTAMAAIFSHPATRDATTHSPTVRISPFPNSSLPS